MRMRSWSNRFSRWIGSKIFQKLLGFAFRSICTLAFMYSSTSTWGSDNRGRTLLWEKLSYRVLGQFGMELFDTCLDTLIGSRQQAEDA